MCLFIYQLDIFGIIKPATSGFCRFANHQRCDLLLGIPMYTPTWDYCNVGPKSYKLVFKTPLTIVISIIKHSYWSYVHQLRYLGGHILFRLFTIYKQSRNGGPRTRQIRTEIGSENELKCPKSTNHIPQDPCTVCYIC